MNYRVIGKIGFLVIFFGFFMPLGCDMNGFQWAGSSYVSAEFSFGLYGLFISAIAGIILGIGLFREKKIPVTADWLILIACSLCVWIPFFCNVKYADYFQTGVYVILTGYFIVLIFQLISASKGDGTDVAVERKLPESGNNTAEQEPVRKGRYKVTKVTALNDSLSLTPKTIRILNAGEEVEVSHTLKRDAIGGEWAMVRTQSDNEGWCLFEALNKEVLE